jgi:hypothetical protein
MATRQAPPTRAPVALAYSNAHAAPVVVCSDGAAFVLRQPDTENPDGWVQIDPVPGSAHARARAAEREE